MAFHGARLDEQGWIAVAGDETFVVWTVGREGELILSKLDNHAPVKIADSARDPVIVASSKPTSKVVVVWESRQGDTTVIKGQSLID